MVLDSEAGKAVKRGSMAGFNSNSSSGDLKWMYDAKDSSGNNYLLGIQGTTFIRSLNGTGAWESIRASITNTRDAQIVPHFKQYVVTDGGTVPFITDCSTNDWDLDIDRPDISSTTSADSAGGNLDASAEYKWILIYITENGEKSEPSKPFTHYIVTDGSSNHATDGTNKTITFSSLPVSADTRVTGRLLYRTEGDGDIYYLLSTLDNVTTSFVDNRADSDLDTSDSFDFIDVPSKAQSIAIHQDRLFLGNVTLRQRNFIEPPVALGTYDFRGDETVGGSGSLDPSADYKYRVVFVDEFGLESDYVETATITTDADGIIQLLNIPTLSSLGGLGIYRLRIYRTEGGQATFKFLREEPVDMNNEPDSITDTASDASLGADYSALSTQDHPSSIVFSEIGEIATIPVLNIIPIFPDDGDEITGLVDDRDGIIILKERSINKIFTQGHPQNWRVERLKQGVGANKYNNFVSTGNKIYFYSSLDDSAEAEQLSQIYRFPDYLDTPIGLLRDDTMSSATCDFGNAVYLPTRKWVVFLLDVDASFLLIYDEKLDVWYKFTLSADGWGCVGVKNHGTAAGRLLIANTDHVCGYDEDGTLDWDDGTETNADDISPTIRFKTIADDLGIMRLRKIHANYKKLDGKTVTHTLYDVDAQTSKVQNDTTNATMATDYKDFEQNSTDAMTGALQRTRKFYYKISGTGLVEFNNAKVFFTRKDEGSR